MVERVADAIGCVNYGNCFQDVPPAKCESCKTSARRAIEAMREPTYKMMMVDAPDMPAGGSVVEIWQDMIDAALREHSVREPS